jgi:hypothetical protein
MALPSRRVFYTGWARPTPARLAGCILSSPLGHGTSRPTACARRTGFASANHGAHGTPIVTHTATHAARKSRRTRHAHRDASHPLRTAPRDRHGRRLIPRVYGGCDAGLRW